MLSITTTSKAYASSASKTDIKKSSLEAGSDSWECHQSQVDYEQDECVAVFFYLMCFCVLFVDVCCCYCYYCAICCVQQQKESNKFRLINTQKIISFFLLFSSYKPPWKCPFIYLPYTQITRFLFTFLTTNTSIDQRCARFTIQLDIFRASYSIGFVFHAQPGSWCSQRVSWTYAYFLVAGEELRDGKSSWWGVLMGFIRNCLDFLWIFLDSDLKSQDLVIVQV